MIEDTADPLKNNIEFEGEVKGAQIGNHNIIYNYFYYREEVKPASLDVADDNLPCPYRGLFHFGPNDADVFFGREIFIEGLYSATKTKNFIPVLGASGSGKSSVVFAGLVPKLQKEGYWQFTHFRPGSVPFYALAEALIPLYTPELDPTDQIVQTRKLAGHLFNNTVSLADVFRKIQQNHPNHRVLLIADQFEELYTLCNNDEIRRNFFDCLLASLGTTTPMSASATVLVTTMRADFLGNALSYRPLADVLQNADVKLGPMNRKELTEVIEKPAQKLGVKFEQGLIERILNDVENQPGNLPLLEFALTELWNKRTGKQLTHKVYEEIGQVEGALARHADEKYGNLTDDEKEKVRRIFIQLVRPGEGTEDTRRIAMKAELGEQSWSLVKQLADARLVVTSRNTNQETVEVVHEALIRNWGELREWMNTNRVFRTWQERLRVAKGQWEATNKDPGSLLRGVALAEAKEKLKERSEDLIDEKEFIEQSIQEDYRQEEEKETARLHELAQAQKLAQEQSLRAEEQSRATRRLRQLVLGLVIAFVMAGVAVVFSLIQLENAKTSRTLTQEQLIESSWTSLQSEISYRKCQTQLQFGLRDLYCRIKPFVDYRKLRVISGVRIFNKGPHTEFDFNFEGGYEFGYYNPEFLEWIQEKAIIDPSNSQLKEKIQSAYNDKLRVVARAFYQSHKILFATPEEFKAFKEKYKAIQIEYKYRFERREVNSVKFNNEPLEFEEIKREYHNNIENKTLTPESLGTELQDKFRWLADYLSIQNENTSEKIKGEEYYWYVAKVSGGFWVRRSIDGTEKQFFDILTKLLSIYDKDWLHQQEFL